MTWWRLAIQSACFVEAFLSERNQLPVILIIFSATNTKGTKLLQLNPNRKVASNASKTGAPTQRLNVRLRNMMVAQSFLVVRLLRFTVLNQSYAFTCNVPSHFDCDFRHCGNSSMDRRNSVIQYHRFTFKTLRLGASTRRHDHPGNCYQSTRDRYCGQCLLTAQPWHCNWEHIRRYSL